MSLEQIATIASIISSVAVVLTLIFVGLQIKHNSRVNRLAASLSGAQLLSQNLGRVMEHPDLAELIVAGNDDDKWSPADRLRVTNFLSVSMRHYEILHAHRRYGIYEEDLWLGTEARLKESLANAAIRTWWQENRHFYAGSFAAYVDEIIAGMKAR